MNGLALMILVVYLLVILGIGLSSSRKIENTTDYLVAGRRLGPFLVAISLAATGIDGGSTVGVVSGASDKWGASAIWYPLSIALAFFLLSFLAPRLWKTRERTVPEFVRSRYGKWAGALSGLLSILSLVGLIAAQLGVSASILEVMVGVDYNVALLTVAVIVSVYSVLGGLRGVMLTDALQYLLILVGMGITIPFALKMAGGWSAVQAAVPAESLSLTAGMGGWGQILGYLLLFFTSFAVGEEILPCYYAAEDGRAARRGSLLAGLGVLVYAAIPVILGITIAALENLDVLPAGVTAAMEQSGRYALPALVAALMPTLVVVILFAGILSATMSSADSCLLGAGSIYSNDIYRVFLCPKADERRLVAVTRLAMVFLMLCAFVTAIYQRETLTVVTVSLSLRAVGTFIPYVSAHCWSGGSRAGCLASLVSGTVVYVIVSQRIVDLPMISAILPALASSALFFFLFSRIFPDKKLKTKIEK